MTRFNAAFARWFGDSKVVDENGEPLVVYHGTQEPKLFSAFARRGLFEQRQTHPYALADDNELGFFFDADPGWAPDLGGMWHGAAGFAGVVSSGGDPKVRPGSRTIPAYLSLQNPLILGWTEYVHFVNEKGGGLRAAVWLKQNGYDGVIRLDLSGRPSHFIALYPAQIKSIWNVGTWDPEDPDIRRNPAHIHFWLSRGEVVPVDSHHGDLYYNHYTGRLKYEAFLDHPELMHRVQLQAYGKDSVRLSVYGLEVGATLSFDRPEAWDNLLIGLAKLGIVNGDLVIENAGTYRRRHMTVQEFKTRGPDAGMET